MPIFQKLFACRPQAKFGLALSLLSFAVVGTQAQEAVVTAAAPVGFGRVERTLEGERGLRDRIEAFFVSIEAGKTAEAFKVLMAGSPMASKPESIDKLVEDTAQITETYGAVRAHELIRVSRVGSRMIRFTYLTYSDDFPLKWELYCFLGKVGWQMLDFNVNNSFMNLFDAPSTRRVTNGAIGAAERP